MAGVVDEGRSTPSHGRPLLQIAPMMDVTYRDFRYFMRLLTRRAQLWTEMVVDDTVLHNLEPVKCDRFLGFHPTEHPVVCQVGGSDPTKLAEVAQVVERYGYDEINLNVGCPSCRVSLKGEFGCSLMKRKEAVRDIIHAMSRTVQIPVTVKCRLGVDDLDSQEFTKSFVSTVAAGGCKHFIIHSRKAWLNGLSPAQNRSVPPLSYDRVRDLCCSFPDLHFSLNGGVNDVGHARALLGFPGDRLPGETDDLIGAAWMGAGDNAVPSNLQGVMIGRGAMNTPMMLWDVDSTIYGDAPRSGVVTRRNILESYRDYLQDAHPEGDADKSVGSVHLALKPTLGVFAGMRGNKAFRISADSLMRVKSNRELGPAHILEQAMASLEAASPGLLDEPCQPTRAYSHKPTAVAETDGGLGGGRERKRKRGGSVGPEGTSNPQESAREAPAAGREVPGGIDQVQATRSEAARASVDGDSGLAAAAAQEPVGTIASSSPAKVCRTASPAVIAATVD